MPAFVLPGAGFLVAVLWFDLMFDVQVRGEVGDELPEPALASIAGYYRRATTDAYPMNRLIAASMVGTLAAIVVQLVRDDVPRWVSVASAGLAALAIGLAASRTVPNAVRFGTRRDSITDQSALARSVFHDHVVCIALIVPLLIIQLAWA